MFKIAAVPITVEELKRSFGDERAGALVTFEGWVRNNNEGNVVLALEYEAYEALCTTEAEKIFEEAQCKFDIINATCVHRVGALKVGELAVWVGASAAHRGDAFAACRYIIDEIKLRLPIWKKETYVNGDSGWINCQRCTSHAHEHESSANPHGRDRSSHSGEQIHEDGRAPAKAALAGSKTVGAARGRSATQTNADGQNK